MNLREEGSEKRVEELLEATEPGYCESSAGEDHLLLDLEERRRARRDPVGGAWSPC